jgi:hypothetical protein
MPISLPSDPTPKVWPFLLQSIRPFKGWICFQTIIGIGRAIDVSLRAYLLKYILNALASVETSQLGPLLGLVGLYCLQAL